MIHGTVPVWTRRDTVGHSRFMAFFTHLEMFPTDKTLLDATYWLLFSQIAPKNGVSRQNTCTQTIQKNCRQGFKKKKNFLLAFYRFRGFANMENWRHTLIGGQVVIGGRI
jgi:hypothetical protein